MGEGDYRWIDHEVPPRSFNKSAEITVWDKDGGGPDEDSYGGVADVYPKDADQGDKRLRMQFKDMDYTVIARVTSEEPPWPP